MFKRTTYQQGSLKLEERKRGSDVWVYRWWDTDVSGKRVYRKHQIGDLEQYPHQTAAKAAIDALRLTINNQSQRNGAGQMTVQALWDHYSREELPCKDFSTQDAYLSYAKIWILPRWGSVLLQRVKTVEVERWLRDATVSNGTRAKIKCVMSALYSCRALGVSSSQSDLIGNTRRNGREAGSKHGRSCECKTTAGTNCFVTRPTQTGTFSA